MSARGARIAAMPTGRFVARASGWFLAFYVGAAVLEWCAHAFGVLS